MEREFDLIITEGAKPYQIFQQENGFAEIKLKGKVKMSDEIRGQNARVVVHLTDENTGSFAIPPVTAKLSGDDWEAVLKVPVGGLYTIRTYLRSLIRDERCGDMVQHIGVGDVYLIVGQSNAEGTSKRGICDPVSTQVHMYKFSGDWDLASHPLSDCTDSKYERYYSRGYRGEHSPWLAFARHINSVVGYPIGLVMAAQGGVPLSFYDKEENGELFDDMLDILKDAGGKAKGVLWYQGCTDTDERLYAAYLERFKRVCADIRKALGFEIPFITVQLNKFNYCDPNTDINKRELFWAEVRNTQRLAAHQIKDVYVVPSFDLMTSDTIHNQPYSNLVIAERTANVALKYIYGRDNPCEAPDIEKAVLENGKKLILYFNNVYDAIATDYYIKEALPFQVKDAVGTQSITDYECTGDNRLILYFERDIILPATVGCTKFTDSGFMPYDYTTRLPALCFNDIQIEKQ